MYLVHNCLCVLLLCALMTNYLMTLMTNYLITLMTNYLMTNYLRAPFHVMLALCV